MLGFLIHKIAVSLEPAFDEELGFRAGIGVVGTLQFSNDPVGERGGADDRERGPLGMKDSVNEREIGRASCRERV